MKKKHILIAAAALCTVAVIAGAGAVGFHLGQQAAITAPASMETVLAQGQNMGAISVPGFDRMIVKAGKTEQEAALFNPQGNDCYFVLTMYLPDGSEIYHSSKLAPGEKLEKIELERALEAGTYDGATLRYACYAFDDLKPLNGADINFRLEVEP